LVEHALFDHLIRLEEQRLWDRQPERLILLRTVSYRGDEKEEEEEKRKPPMVARSLLTRGPPSAEPPEAHAKSVPVGKRTAPEVQEKVAPRRAGIRRTGRSCSSAASA
jgi:hypothetical protein